MWKAESPHFIQILIVISRQSDNSCSNRPGSDCVAFVEFHRYVVGKSVHWQREKRVNSVNERCTTGASAAIWLSDWALI